MNCFCCRPRRAPLVLVLLLGAACSSRASSGTGGGSSAESTTLSGTSEASSTLSSSTGNDSSDPKFDMPNPPDTGYEGSETQCPFVPCPDMGDTPWCDIFDDDACGEGYKCTAVSSEPGGSPWDMNACVPIQGDGQLGDECSVFGDGTDGLDNCDDGLMCFNADSAGIGTCFAFCDGTPNEPVCPPMNECAISAGGALTLCIPTCDPLNADCNDGFLCAPNTNGTAFSCVLDASGGMYPYGEPCEYVNQCNPGLACVQAEQVPEATCMGANGCCSPYCDLTLPESCPAGGTTCQPWWPAGTAPLGYAHVGVCATGSP